MERPVDKWRVGLALRTHRKQGKIYSLAPRNMEETHTRTDTKRERERETLSRGNLPTLIGVIMMPNAAAVAAAADDDGA